MEVTYRIISGNKDDFEGKLKELSKESFFDCGNLNTFIKGDVVYYAQMVTIYGNKKET